MTKVKIIGQSITRFGELWDRSLESLFEQAIWESLISIDGPVYQKQIELRKYGVTTQIPRFDVRQVEAVFVANMSAQAFTGQSHLGALVSQMLPHNPPAIRVEGACASGGLALVAAQQALLSGQYKTVLVVGAEKMTDVSATQTTKILSGASEYQSEYGSTFPALYSLLAQAHMDAFGTTRNQLSMVSSKNHAHAVENPKAQFRKKISADVVGRSALIADPIRLLDCSPVSDGASAVVLSTKNIKRYQGKPVIAGFGHAQDTLNLADRKSLTELEATKKAGQIAYRAAGIKPKDIKFAEVHDCFTIAEILASEDLGFFTKGSGGTAAEQGQTTYGGKIVINPSGGLKACGHPVGATGVKQLAYVASKLQEVQKKRVYALTHNVGGSGATAVVHIVRNGIYEK